MRLIELKGKSHNLSVGDSSPILVNCNVGGNTPSALDSEKEKIDILFNRPETTPDTMMDLSIFDKQGVLSNYISVNYGVPVGVVPVYAFTEDELNESSLLDQIEKYAEMGVAFMTMHITADTDIYDIAIKEREIPVTSRGGAIVLKEAYKRHGANIFRVCLNRIIALSKKYKFAISLGATFRPAGLVDACDKVHIMETLRQVELSNYLQREGVQVIVENVGHIDIDKIQKHAPLLRRCNAPIMPLGPSVIDTAIGYDHISASIGASFMAYHNVAHIINAISPSEHLTAFFSVEDAQEAVASAKIAARSVNVIRCKNIMDEEIIAYKARAKSCSCIIAPYGDICKRCSKLCPLRKKIYDK